MICPRCETAALIARRRDGVEVDVCEGCRGVWLDRGELDKLLRRADDDDDDDDGRDHRDHRDDRERRDRDDAPRPRRRRGWLDSLGDLFD